MNGLSTHLVDGSPAVLHVRGELDLATADEFASALTAALRGKSGVIIDMAELTFIDAAGVRVILQAAHSMNGSGPLRLRNAGRVGWLLSVVGLEGLASIEVRDQDDRHAG